ncbi:MAG: glycosyltransferase family 2 protein, partial [Actinobacteria bacterium]|nr:glycosyltransferase family 2 protein [Actinomycetota bacterium]
MIVMTLVVRDEGDIVGWNLDYHFSLGVDLCLVTLHRSRDGTRSLLADHERRGRVYVFEEDDEGFAQGRWVTRMARLAHRQFGADWVVHVDADEFWWPRGGDLRQALGKVPRWVGGALVQRKNARPVARDDVPFFERMVVYTRDSVNPLGEPLPPKVCHRGAADVVVVDGNHAAVSRVLGPIVATDSIQVLHFPMRTYAQFAAKIEKGSRALAANAEIGPEIGHVWRHL